MGLQPTASKTALLLQCPRPYADDVELDGEEEEQSSRPKRGNTEARDYGTAFHFGMQNLSSAIPEMWDAYMGPAVARWGNELYAHCTATLKEVQEWEASRGLTFYRAEESRKLAWGDGGVRYALPAEFDHTTHTYTDLEPGEIGGTYDRLSRGIAANLEGAYPYIAVLDYKTGEGWGEDFSRPGLHPQMLTLAAMTDADEVVIVHTPRGGPITIYSEPVDEDALRRHEEALHRSLQFVGSGMLRVGPACKRCPARGSCPAGGNAETVSKALTLVRRLGGSGTAMSTATDPGALHQLLEYLNSCSKLARQNIKDALLRGEDITRPDGRTLTLRKETRESLSKASILRALGKEEGEKLISHLRSLGAFSLSESEVVRAL